MNERSYSEPGERAMRARHWESAAEHDTRARLVPMLVGLAGAVMVCAGLAGIGGSHGVSRLIRFREQGSAVTVAGFLLLSLFVTSVALLTGVLATGGRDRGVLRLANVAAKSSFALAVAFMFVFPHLQQFDGKTMTLRAIIYPVCVAAPGVGWLLHRPRGPYPLFVDLVWGFTFTFDIVSNDLHWYGAFGSRDVWADFVHLTNSVPMFLAVAGVLLAIERRRGMRAGFWTVLLVALFGFFAAHSAWEMWEFAMDHFAGTGLQPGGMAEASRHNLLGLSGAIVGALLLIRWRRNRTLEAAIIEPTAGYLEGLAAGRWSQLFARSRVALQAEQDRRP